MPSRGRSERPVGGQPVGERADEAGQWRAYAVAGDAPPEHQLGIGGIDRDQRRGHGDADGPDPPRRARIELDLLQPGQVVDEHITRRHGGASPVPCGPDAAFQGREQVVARVIAQNP